MIPRMLIVGAADGKNLPRRRPSVCSAVIALTPAVLRRGHTHRTGQRCLECGAYPHPHAGPIEHKFTGPVTPLIFVIVLLTAIADFVTAHAFETFSGNKVVVRQSVDDDVLAQPRTWKSARRSRETWPPPVRQSASSNPFRATSSQPRESLR